MVLVVSTPCHTVGSYSADGTPYTASMADPGHERRRGSAIARRHPSNLLTTLRTLHLRTRIVRSDHASVRKGSCTTFIPMPGHSCPAGLVCSYSQNNRPFDATQPVVASQLEVRFLRSQHRGGSSLCFATEVTRSRLTPGGWCPVSMVARQQKLNRNDCRWAVRIARHGVQPIS